MIYVFGLTVGESENKVLKSAESNEKYWILKSTVRSSDFTITYIEGTFKQHLIRISYNFEKSVLTYFPSCMCVNSVSYFTGNIVGQIDLSLQLTS